MADIQPITMPKWGLAMEEGMLARWAVEVGAPIAPRPGDHGHRDDEDRQCLREPGDRRAAPPGRRRRRHGAGRRAARRRLRAATCRTPTVDDFVADFLDGFKPAEKGEAGGPAAEIDRGRRPPHPPPQGRPRSRRADPLPSWLRRRPVDLDAQPGGARRRPSGPRHRSARPWRLGEGGVRRLGRGARRGGARLHGRRGAWTPPISSAIRSAGRSPSTIALDAPPGSPA